ncbi:hypothetical protein I0E98_10885 [Pseudomonas lalucatii]|nr:hypothetical protein [Pseudomonas lalucatii]
MAMMDDFYSPNSRECANWSCSKYRYFNGFAVGAVSGGVAAFYFDYVGGAGCSSDPRKDVCYVERSVGLTEQQNFANWFSYYRTRLMMAKAGVSEAFVKQPADIRLGYGAINQSGNTVDGVANTDSIVRGVRRFEGAGRTAFFDWLFAAQASGGTPLRRALGDAGQYYSRQDQQGPWSSTPGLAGAMPTPAGRAIRS